MTTPLPAKPSEVLLSARDVLIRRDWVQSALVDPVTGNVCLRGAVICALHGVEDPRITFDRGRMTEIDTILDREALKRRPEMLNAAKGFEIIIPIYAYWNDIYAQDINEVLDLLFDAAIAAKEEGQ